MSVRGVLTTIWLAGSMLVGWMSQPASGAQPEPGHEPASDHAGEHAGEHASAHASAEVVPSTSGRTGIALGADLAAGWEFYLDRGHCHLELQLPDYGVVRFLGVTGMPLRFEVVGHRDLFADGPVDVYQVTPGWHEEHPARELLGQALHLAGGGVAATDPVATRVLLSLYNGYAAELVRHGWFDDGGEVGVKVANVHVRRYYAQFVDCFKGPLLKSWAAVERTRIGYAADAWQLDDAAREQLEVLAAYLTRDPSVRQIFIDGHTDSTGAARTNLALSRRRAEAAAGYLEDCGVPPEKMVIRYHGGRYPVADNATPEGKDRNRRTTVRLERNWEVADRGAR